MADTGGALWADAPTVHTDQVVCDNDCTVKKGGWADPVDPSTIPKEQWNTGPRQSFEGQYAFDARSRPLNPRGRTGMADRGLLGKWGVRAASSSNRCATARTVCVRVHTLRHCTHRVCGGTRRADARATPLVGFSPSHSPTTRPTRS